MEKVSKTKGEDLDLKGELPPRRTGDKSKRNSKGNLLRNNWGSKRRKKMENNRSLVTPTAPVLIIRRDPILGETKEWEECPAGGRRNNQCANKCEFCKGALGRAMQLLWNANLKFRDPTKCNTCWQYSQEGK